MPSQNPGVDTPKKHAMETTKSGILSLLSAAIIPTGMAIRMEINKEKSEIVIVLGIASRINSFMLALVL